MSMPTLNLIAALLVVPVIAAEYSAVAVASLIFRKVAKNATAKALHLYLIFEDTLLQVHLVKSFRMR